MIKVIVIIFITIFMFIGCGGGDVSSYSTQSYSNSSEQNSNTPNNSNSNRDNNSNSNSNSNQDNKKTTKLSTHKIPTISQSKIDEFLDVINAARADDRMCGDELYRATTKVKWSNALYKSAYEHTQDMAKNRVMIHEGTNTSSDWTAKDLNLNRGSYFYERDQYNGYLILKRVTENVARGSSFSDIQSVVDAWLDSPPHCRNIMDPEVKDVGVAYIKTNSKYTYYWTQEFGVKMKN